MAEIGTASVKVVPDLSEFSALIDKALEVDGLVIRRVVEIEHDNNGMVCREVTTTSVHRASE